MPNHIHGVLFFNRPEKRIGPQINLVYNH
jgi:hypothetical protein